MGRRCAARARHGQRRRGAHSGGRDPPPHLMASTVHGVFVTGTDTGVGKTVVAAARLRARARDGVPVAGMKPIASVAVLTPAGLRNADALTLMRASNVDTPY